MHGTAVQGRGGAAHGTGVKFTAGPRTEEGEGAERRSRAAPSTAEQAASEWATERGRGVEGKGVGGRPGLGLTEESIEDMECGDGPEAGPGGGRREAGAFSTILKQAHMIIEFRELLRR